MPEPRCHRAAPHAAQPVPDGGFAQPEQQHGERIQHGEAKGGDRTRQSGGSHGKLQRKQRNKAKSKGRKRENIIGHTGEKSGVSLLGATAAARRVQHDRRENHR